MRPERTGGRVRLEQQQAENEVGIEREWWWTSTRQATESTIEVLIEELVDWRATSNTVVKSSSPGQRRSCSFSVSTARAKSILWPLPDSTSCGATATGSGQSSHRAINGPQTTALRGSISSRPSPSPCRLPDSESRTRRNGAWVSILLGVQASPVRATSVGVPAPRMFVFRDRRSDTFFPVPALGEVVMCKADHALTVIRERSASGRLAIQSSEKNKTLLDLREIRRQVSRLTDWSCHVSSEHGLWLNPEEPRLRLDEPEGPTEKWRGEYRQQAASCTTTRGLPRIIEAVTTVARSPVSILLLVCLRLIIGRTHIYMHDSLVEKDDGEIIDAHEPPKRLFAAARSIVELDGPQKAQRWVKSYEMFATDLDGAVRSLSVYGSCADEKAALDRQLAKKITDDKLSWSTRARACRWSRDGHDRCADSLRRLFWVVEKTSSASKGGRTCNVMIGYDPRLRKLPIGQANAIEEDPFCSSKAADRPFTNLPRVELELGRLCLARHAGLGCCDCVACDLAKRRYGRGAIVVVDERAFNGRPMAPQVSRQITALAFHERDYSHLGVVATGGSDGSIVF
ncbi:hypothetical protein HMN09_00302300 [Mycena chlorophos]|uniref:Uncharacterized protein n=1 Tax=Mycena chlorophos TaxID=658473 RepID=A0A8H6WI98_MYCCL|nr:hypothetical protein HMN09_00302300 [Mycena chlorophos]